MSTVSRNYLLGSKQPGITFDSTQSRASHLCQSEPTRVLLSVSKCYINTVAIVNFSKLNEDNGSNCFISYKQAAALLDMCLDVVCHCMSVKSVNSVKLNTKTLKLKGILLPTA